MKRDAVGEDFGNSKFFKRLGTDIGPWNAKDDNGNIITTNGIAETLYKLHGINLFFNQSGLTYPNCKVY